MGGGGGEWRQCPAPGLLRSCFMLTVADPNLQIARRAWAGLIKGEGVPSTTLNECVHVSRFPDLMENFQPGLGNSLSPQTLTYCEWREPGEDLGCTQAISVGDCHPSGESRNAGWDTGGCLPAFHTS